MHKVAILIGGGLGDCIWGYFNDDFNEPLNENHIEELKKLIKEGNNELILPDRERDSYKHSIDILSELDELEVLNVVKE